MAILATANINGSGLPAAVDGSACSTLKKTGSNQNPKRTGGASEGASENNAEPVTTFEESLHSTIKDQKGIPQKQQKPDAAGAKVTNSHNTNALRQKIKLNLAPIRYAAMDKTTSDAQAKSDSTQGQQGSAPPATTPDNTPNPAVVAGIASLTALVNALPFDGPTDNRPVTSDPSAVSAVATDPKSEAVSVAAASSPVKLDSGTQVPAGDQETVVFDGTLHSAAPAVTAQPQPDLPGGGRPAWLLNSQPVYTAPETTKKIDSPTQAQETNTANAKPEAPAVSTIAAQNVNQASGQSSDKTAVNSAQPKLAADSTQADRTPLVPAEPARQTGANQSSSNDTPGFEREARQETAAPDKPRSAESAADGPQMVSTPAPDGNRIEAAAQTNTAAVSSKPGTLPIDQLDDTRQPAMKTDLNMRIQGQSGESVNLRISERAGDIQISVRSSDQGTANALKHELPSIEAGLERAGWHMENGGMSQSGQEQREAGRDAQNSDRNREQNPQSPNWQDRNQRRKDPPSNNWFDMEQ